MIRLLTCVLIVLGMGVYWLRRKHREFSSQIAQCTKEMLREMRNGKVAGGMLQIPEGKYLYPEGKIPN